MHLLQQAQGQRQMVREPRDSNLRADLLQAAKLQHMAPALDLLSNERDGDTSDTIATQRGEVDRLETAENGGIRELSTRSPHRSHVEQQFCIS